MKSIKNLKIQKKWLVFIGVIVLCMAGALLIVNAAKKEMPSNYVYENEAEEKLVADVKQYLKTYAGTEEETNSEVANEAVKLYRVILESGVNSVTEEHTEAIENKMLHILNGYTDISEQNKKAISAGICKTIFDALLVQIEESVAAELPEYKAQYKVMTESLQKQIDDLNEKSIAFHINLQVNEDNERVENIAKDIFNSMYSDSAAKNSVSGRDGRDGTNGKDGEDGRDGENGRNGKDGKDGKSGKDGEAGTDGKDGAAGKDGTNGKDGMTTYIAYADDEAGTEFSLTPTSTSRYIGTCMSTDKKQPQSPASYTWQAYREYVIVPQVEDGVTTIYIK